MPGPTLMPGQPGDPTPASPTPDREVNEQDRALARDWLKRIETARDSETQKKAIKEFEDNRKWLRGIDPQSGKRLRVNLHFANLAAMRPQVYAKDPEYSVQPTPAVPRERLALMKKFGETSETVLQHYLVKGARLKRRAKRILTSGYTNGVGWWKVVWQEDRRADAVTSNGIKDSQDNLDQLALQRKQIDDAQATGAPELKAARLRETLAGMEETQSEITVARGIVVDFVMPDDMLVLDPSVLEIADYERADALAHGIWMTREAFQKRFGFNPKKGKVYSEAKHSSSGNGGTASADDKSQLLRVWEIWDQTANRVHTVCEGDEGFCRPSYSPDWTGKRWYCFFLLSFNEVDGGFYPPSDVCLTTEVVKEYNQTRDDFERDRKNSLPLNVVRKGGALTPGDVERLTNRQGGDIVVVEGGSGRPLSEDIWSGQLAQINPVNYDTSAPRQDMEMLVGGGDAARGAVLKAKTATEAEILSQGLRGRSAERTDTIEDLLTDVGTYSLEMCLRKLTPQDVQEIAGPEAQWPAWTADQVFKQVSLSVRGGSTGKPDRLQEQDRWTKLMPVIKEAMAQVAELRAQNQSDMAEAVIALVRETLRRFDERVDIQQFLPEPEEGEQGEQDDGSMKVTPEMLDQAKQMVEELQGKLAECEKLLQDKEADRENEIQRAQINAAADIEKADKVARIDAAAKVQVARITAATPPLPAVDEPQGLAQALDLIAGEMGEGMEGGEMEEPLEPAEPPEPPPPSETQQLIAAVLQGQQQMAEVLAQALAPKPQMQVVHQRDAEGRIVRSVQVPVDGMNNG
jgi:hypothetical protein